MGWASDGLGHIVMDSTMGVGRSVPCPDISSCRLVLRLHWNSYSCYCRGNGGWVPFFLVLSVSASLKWDLSNNWSSIIVRIFFFFFFVISSTGLALEFWRLVLSCCWAGWAVSLGIVGGPYVSPSPRSCPGRGGLCLFFFNAAMFYNSLWCNFLFDVCSIFNDI